MHVQNHTQATRGSPEHIEDYADNTNRQQDHAMPVAGRTTGSASAANASSTRSSARCPSGSASSPVAAFASACRASSRRSCRSWKLCGITGVALEGSQVTLRVRQQRGRRLCQRLPRLLAALLPLLEALQEETRFLEFTLRVRQQCGCRLCQRLPRFFAALLPLLEALRQCLGFGSRFRFCLNPNS